jgi:hypothetical protein
MLSKKKKRVIMPLWYLAKQVSIDWSSSKQMPDRRPLLESIAGFFSEIIWASLIILFLISIITIIWLVSLI